MSDERRPKLIIQVSDGLGKQAQYTLETSTTIGRDEKCEIRIDHPNVSRRHAEFYFHENAWWFRDLHSSNGSFVDGEATENLWLTGKMTIRLGRNGPEITTTVENIIAGPAEREHPAHQDADYYFRESADGENVGEKTMFIRKAFKEVRRKHRRRNRILIGVSTAILLSVGIYALHQRSLANHQRELAEELFYSIKSAELESAKSEEAMAGLRGPDVIKEIDRNRAKRAQLEAKYENFVKEMGLYSGQLSEQDRLILRVTRIFGECEIGMPGNYVNEVKRYIGYWKSTDRLEKALNLAKTHGYTSRISAALLDQNLPPQFFYLALQESGFNTHAVGPRTYKGYAKGMWQFIPETAIKYGLVPGPLQDLPRPDPGDERDDFEKSTVAAARYLKFIYSTDAQASGLLVMASYNWGEGKVIPLIQKLPANPRDRNFWQLLSTDREKLPQETYDYVFYIVAAAVIGENPRAFGFGFENPLRYLERE